MTPRATRAAANRNAPASATRRATRPHAADTRAAAPCAAWKSRTLAPASLALAMLALVLTGCNLQGGATTVVGGPTPQPAVPPIAHDCILGDDALNPDPSRYLAVVVRDANGDPVANRDVGFAWFGAQGHDIGTSIYTTDTNGVATSLDHSTMPYLPTGAYSGMIAVDGADGMPGLFTACGNVPIPGTVAVQEGDPTLVDVTLDVRDGTTPLVGTTVQFGYVWDQVARLSTRLDPGPTGTVEAVEGTYLLGIAATEADTTYALYQPVTVQGDTTVSVDVSTAPTYDLRYTVRDGGGTSASSGSVGLFRVGTDVEQVRGVSVVTPNVRVTPGTYDVNAGLTLRDSYTSWWSYGFSASALALSPAGSSRTLSIGGPLSARLTTDRATYAPGDTVDLRPEIRDAAGFGLYRVSHSDTATQTYELAKLTLTVRDASGGLVVETVTPYTWVDSFALQSTAPSGTYTATLDWPIGPYRSGPLTATTTFQVR